jgi:hypothetical protein
MWHLKVEIARTRIETAVMQQPSKDTTIEEPQKVVFCMWSLLRLYTEDLQNK